MKTIPYALYLIPLFLLITSCAQVVAPAGGQQDKTPPRAVKYVPDSASVNFQSNEIVIDFNEYIQLKDISQVVVSPPLSKTPVIKAKNRQLKIEWEAPLEDSTTYSLNFGGAIADITESNPTENFTYIFSTGNFIDSIAVTGKVDVAFDHKTEKGVLVMLYRDVHDSVPVKKIPDYFARTKEDGAFRINNIKRGKYKVFALKDANANYLYDSPEENIGFLDTLVDLDKNTELNISLFKELPGRQFLRKAVAGEYGHILFIFNMPVEGLNIAPLNFTAKKEWYEEEYSSGRDTVHYWLMGVNAMDTLKLQVSDKRGVMDTVEVKTIAKEQVGGRGAKFALTVKTNIAGGNLDLDEPIRLLFNHPVKKHDFEKIRFTVDSAGLSGTDIYNKLYFRSMSIRPEKKDTNKPWKENANYNIFIPPGTFTDMFDLTNDTVKIDFKTTELKGYGTLKLKINTRTPQDQRLIVQLINSKGNVENSGFLPDNKILTYEYLTPGPYTLKLIYDVNKNGQWDTGNYFKKTQPEKTIFFSSPIEIRANWDVEQEWNVE